MPLIKNPQELCFPKGSRALGIDYGDKRVGIAVSDTTLSISSSLTVLPSHNLFAKLFQIIDKYNVFLIVIGLPLTLSGNVGGKQLEKVQKFVDKLLSLRDINALLWDERMSTHAAMRYVYQAELSKNKQKQIKDKIAASFILQGVLDLGVWSKDK